MSESSSAINFRNIVILLGVVITAVALIYMATEYLERISEWGRVISLMLVTVMLVALGRHFEQDVESTLYDRSGWRWLRVTSAFYLLGLLASFTAVIVFLGMDDLDPIFKVLAALALGLGLILIAASRFGQRGAG